MPAVSIHEAVEKLAKVVEKAKPDTLVEIYEELYPEKATPSSANSADIVRHIRNGLAAEEVVDLWNVVFPKDNYVWYNEETKAIHFNEELVESAD